MTAPPDAPSVSVLVAVLDEAAFIERTAPGITQQRYDGPLEVLFLDGGSRDGTLDHLRRIAVEDDRVRVLDNPGRTQVAALNLGLREARGDVVVQMDAHTFYEPEYVAAGVRRLQRGDIEWVSGPPVPLAVDAGSRRVAAALASRFGTGGADKWRAAGAGQEVVLDTGVFAGVWRRETLERLGGWDERFVVNHDAELAARHLERGGTIVCVPELASRYVPRSTVRGLWRQYRGYGYFRAGTCRLHPESMRPSHVLSIVPAATLLAAFLPGRAGRLARAGLIVYAVVAGAVSARLPLEHRADAGRMPAVFAAMHFSWGFGFVAGCRRFGVPWAAFASVGRRLVSRARPRARP